MRAVTPVASASSPDACASARDAPFGRARSRAGRLRHELQAGARDPRARPGSYDALRDAIASCRRTLELQSHSQGSQDHG